LVCVAIATLIFLHYMALYDCCLLMVYVETSLCLCVFIRSVRFFSGFSGKNFYVLCYRGNPEIFLIAEHNEFFCIFFLMSENASLGRVQ